MGINESTVKYLNYFDNRIILVFLYQNDVKVNSGLVYLYMYMHLLVHVHALRHTFLWNIIEYFAVTGLAQEPRDLVNELPFKVSPVIALDPIKTLYSVA